MEEFTFLGFLSRRKGRIRKELENAGAERTLVFFESPFRIQSTLEAAREAFGDAPACVARELTKMHEEFIRGTVGTLLNELAARPALKGEVTGVLAPQLMNDPETSHD